MEPYTLIIILVMLIIIFEGIWGKIFDFSTNFFSYLENMNIWLLRFLYALDIAFVIVCIFVFHVLNNVASSLVFVTIVAMFTAMKREVVNRKDNKKITHQNH